MKPILKAFKPLTPCSKQSILSNANWSGCCHSLIFVARVFKVFNTAFWVIAWLVFSFDEKNS
ncbi:hypothetical protein FIM85_00350 [Helicobacter pylori]|nr:hypothetical protein FIM85_00350 [Helicobacter pylori]